MKLLAYDINNNNLLRLQLVYSIVLVGNVHDNLYTIILNSQNNLRKLCVI